MEATKQISIVDELLKSNPEKAFQMIYDQYYNTLCQVSYKLLLDRNAAEDIVQEVILELWNKKENLEISISLIAYLRRAVYNRSLNFIKIRNRITDDDSSLVYVQDTQETVEESLYGQELKTRINDVIESLPEKCRYVFSLSRYEEKTYAEIAEILDISVKTVENQISKALKILRNNLVINN